MMRVTIAKMPMKDMPEMEDDAEEEKTKTPDEWEIKSWMQTLIDAEEIRNDPAKMKHVMPLLQKKAKTIKSLADLRQIASEKASDNESA